MAISFHSDPSTPYTLKGRVALRGWLTRVARQEGFRVGEINYIFCSSQMLLEMNRQYLSHNYYTDIITFDYSDLDGGYISGDIYIDVETVTLNAFKYGATPTAEMHRVIVHGILHLCGQKDKRAEDNRQMHAKEDLYLSLLT